jgi:beta-fructofuranosidase
MNMHALSFAALCAGLAACAALPDGASLSSVEAKSRQAHTPYRLFAKPPAPSTWVGDLMPMGNGDTIELYFLADERDGRPGGFHPIHKFSTADLLHYRYDGEAIPWARDPGEPDLAIGTGSVIVINGTCHAFYTGHNPRNWNSPRPVETVMHAVSADSITFTKIKGDTFHAPPRYEQNDFRDPFVFWNAQAGEYWMLIAARKTFGRGVIAVFRSADLSHWTLREPPLYEPYTGWMLECPDLFEMGGRWYLIYSDIDDRYAHYVMSESPAGPWHRPPGDDTFDGQAFYAPKTAALGGKRYLFGWIPTKDGERDENGYGWGGNLGALEIHQNDDYTLSVKMPEPFSGYFSETREPLPASLIGNASLEGGIARLSGGARPAGVDFGETPPSLLFEAEVTFGGLSRGAAFAVGAPGSCERWLGVSLDPVRNLIRYDSVPLARMKGASPRIATPFPFRRNVPFNLKVLIEKDILVIYVDEKKALSNRIYAMPGAHFGVFSLGGKVTFSDLRMRVPGGN